MHVHVVEHPLAAARLTTLRDARTDNAAFRTALRDLTLMLVYEATGSAPVESSTVRTPVAETTGYRLANPPLLVPVLRAGLGMVDQAHALIPEARVGFVGMARDEDTWQPTPYLESLPADLSAQPVFVLDPMLATGGSMVYTLELLHARGAADITMLCVVAAPQGVTAVKSAPSVSARRRPCGCSLPRSTRASTTPPTSCPGWAMPVTASSGPDSSAASDVPGVSLQLGDHHPGPDPRHGGVGDHGFADLDVAFDLWFGSRRPEYQTDGRPADLAREDHRVGALLAASLQKIFRGDGKSGQGRGDVLAQSGHHRFDVLE